MVEGCGRDFEVWSYDENGMPYCPETLECGFACNLCEDCKKKKPNYANVLEDDE